MSSIKVFTNGEWKIKWTCDDILATNANICIVNGGKNIGKSYSVKKHCIETAFEGEKAGNGKFILMRRRTSDATPKKINMYFGEKSRKVIKEATKGEFEHIFAYADKLYFGRYDKKTLKPIREMECGYYLSAYEIEGFSSLELEDTSNIIFEEWQTTGRYMNDEPNQVRRLISTVERDNTIRLWMLANNISVISPYVEAWGLSGIPKQKPGTIDIYNIPVKDYDNTTSDGEKRYFKIAVEQCSISDSSKAILFKKDKEDGYMGTSYLENDYPTYRFSTNDNVVHEVIVEYDGFKFIMRLIVKDNDTFWYVEPLTRYDINKMKDKRHVGNVYRDGFLYTRDFTPLNQGERTAFDLMKRGKIKYCTCLCGTNFNTALVNIKKGS